MLYVQHLRNTFIEAAFAICWQDKNPLGATLLDQIIDKHVGEKIAIDQFNR